MVKVRAKADMISFMEWVGEVPDDIPEDQRWFWIKHNIDDGEFYEPNQFDGDWVVSTDVEVLTDEEWEAEND